MWICSIIIPKQKTNVTVVADGNFAAVNNIKIEMKDELKVFLAEREISEEEYKSYTGELKLEWSKLFEQNKPQGILPSSIMSLIWCCNQT